MGKIVFSRPLIAKFGDRSKLKERCLRITSRLLVGIAYLEAAAAVSVQPRFKDRVLKGVGGWDPKKRGDTDLF